MIDAAGSRVRDLCTKLGIELDPQLVELALTHRSWAFENGTGHNERLEFLGDAVLGVVVTDHLYHAHPDEPEGRLAKMRASVVNTHALAGVARTLNLGAELRLGKGELATGGADKDSILADATEALIAAVYLSVGRQGAADFVHALMDPLLANASGHARAMDWKTELQELCASQGLDAPVYEHTSTGPDHDKRFVAVAVIGDRRFTGEVGKSKKVAEQDAAQHAMRALHGDA